MNCAAWCVQFQNALKCTGPLIKTQQVLGRTNRLLSLIRLGLHRKLCVQQFFSCYLVFFAAVTFLLSRCLAKIGESTYRQTDGRDL
jgi:hypothetical protein